MDKKEIEIVAENFANSYFLHEDDEWEQIVEYEEHIPRIIREVVNLMSYSLFFEVKDKKGLYKDIMQEIEQLKKLNNNPKVVRLKK